jgi:hypothetical protein
MRTAPPVHFIDLIIFESWEEKEGMVVIEFLILIIPR